MVCVSVFFYIPSPCLGHHCSIKHRCARTGTQTHILLWLREHSHRTLHSVHKVAHCVRLKGEAVSVRGGVVWKVLEHGVFQTACAIELKRKRFGCVEDKYMDARRYAPTHTHARPALHKGIKMHVQKHSHKHTRTHTHTYTYTYAYTSQTHARTCLKGNDGCAGGKVLLLHHT